MRVFRAPVGNTGREDMMSKLLGVYMKRANPIGSDLVRKAEDAMARSR